LAGDCDWNWTTAIRAVNKELQFYQIKIEPADSKEKYIPKYM
jgi:hypothetical protein